MVANIHHLHTASALLSALSWCICYSTTCGACQNNSVTSRLVEAAHPAPSADILAKIIRAIISTSVSISVTMRIKQAANILVINPTTNHPAIFQVRVKGPGQNCNMTYHYILIQLIMNTYCEQALLTESPLQTVGNGTKDFNAGLS